MAAPRPSGKGIRTNILYLWFSVFPFWCAKRWESAIPSRTEATIRMIDLPSEARATELEPWPRAKMSAMRLFAADH